MAQLTITVPDAQVPRILAAFEARLDLPPGTITVNEVRQELIALLKNIVRNYERRQAELAIVISDVDAT